MFDKIIEIIKGRNPIDMAVHHIRRGDLNNAFNMLSKGAVKQGWEVNDLTDEADAVNPGIFTIGNKPTITIKSRGMEPVEKVVQLAHELPYANVAKRALSSRNPMKYLQHNYHKAIYEEYRVIKSLPDYSNKSNRLDYLAVLRKRAIKNPNFFKKEFTRILSK